MAWRDTLKNAAAQGVQEKIQEHWPKVQQLFREKVGPQLRDHLADPEKVIQDSRIVFSLLPFPIKLVVKEDVFVQFCLEHKDDLLPER